MFKHSSLNKKKKIVGAAALAAAAMGGVFFGFKKIRRMKAGKLAMSENISSQKCEEVMTKEPRACLPSDTLAQAVSAMKEEDVGSIPIVNKETKKLIGIITDRDIALNLGGNGMNPKETSIEKIMSRDPIACHEEDSLAKAMKAMASHQIRRIPIVDHENKLVGIIAQADVARRKKDPEKTAEVLRKISR